MNHDVACDRGEEEQQIPHVGAVEIEVTNTSQTIFIIGNYFDIL